MNAELRIYPESGYVLVGLSNLDPPAAENLVEYFSARMPLTDQVAAAVPIDRDVLDSHR